MRRTAFIPSLGAIALLVLACTSAGTSVPSVPPAPSPTTPGGGGGSPSPAAAGALVLRVVSQGGLLAPNALRVQIPMLSVYADGRIMSAGAVPAIYPGPLMTTVVFRSVGADGAAAILKAATDAGLTGPDVTYPGGRGADMPSTVITVIHGGRRTVTTFAFLEAPASLAAPGDSAGQVEAAASALLGRLQGGDTFGGTAGPEGAYEPLGYQVFATPAAPAPSDSGLARPPVDWPLATPLAALGKPDPLGGDGARVGLVTGADAATLGPVLANASQLTGFRSGGQVWTLAVRPLLPDEVTAGGG
jgi:hypothetical protein